MTLAGLVTDVTQRADNLGKVSLVPFCSNEGKGRTRRDGEERRGGRGRRRRADRAKLTWSERLWHLQQRRFLLDDWEIGMMERDRRLTGHRRGQRVSSVPFSSAFVPSSSSSFELVSHPSPSSSSISYTNTPSLSLSPSSPILTPSPPLVCLKQDDPNPPSWFATNAIWRTADAGTAEDWHLPGVRDLKTKIWDKL